VAVSAPDAARAPLGLVRHAEASQRASHEGSVLTGWCDADEPDSVGACAQGATGGLTRAKAATLVVPGVMSFHHMTRRTRLMATAQFISICRWLQLSYEHRLAPLAKAPFSTP
jgi:hypothetical protein